MAMESLLQAAAAGFGGAEVPEPPLNLELDHICYGASDGSKVFLQNRRLYRPNGRCLTHEELADADQFYFVNHAIRHAVATDMQKPRTPPRAPEPLKEMTPDEQLDVLDKQLSNPANRQTITYQSKGITLKSSA